METTNTTANRSFESVRNEDLRPGDVIDLIGGTKTIAAIRPYVGALANILFAIADLEPAPYRDKAYGISLDRGGYSDRLVRL